MKLSMRRVLVLMTLVPLIFGMVASTVIAAVFVKSSLESQTKNTLSVAANGLKQYYESDVKNGGEIPYEHEYVDEFKNQEVDLTVFIGDTRYMTSILDENGKRIEGTKVSEAVIKAVLQNGEEYYSDDVKINNIPYYVYYMPMKDGDGNVIGMAFAGKQCQVVKDAIRGIVIILAVMSNKDGGIAINATILIILMSVICKCLLFDSLIKSQI